MKIVFAGTPLNAARTLESLISAGFEIVGVLTRKDAPVGRAKTLTQSPVAEAAERHGIPVMRANQISQEVSDWIQGLNPELGVIVAYGTILRSNVLEIPSKGWINVHYSLLPKYPGASPVQHAILNGDPRTGVTIFRLDEGVDTGPILSQREVDIEDQSSSGELLNNLTEVGAALLVEALSSIDDLILKQQPQIVPSDVTVAGKISRADARLDFSRPAPLVHDFVRAMNPEPVAWFEYLGTQVRVLKTSLKDVNDLAPGEAKLASGELVVGCSAGSVSLLQVQPAGKREMPGVDWFRGLRKESILIS